MNALKRVTVYWKDSATPFPHWDTREHYASNDGHGILLCESTGYLLKRDKRCVRLVTSCAENDDVSGGISIPVGCITRIETLSGRRRAKKT